MDEHPASIGKYDLEEFLGGGMSRVYRARDRLLGRTVCIKILTAQGTADPDVRERFLLEARLAGNFCHDNVVSIYDFGEDGGNPFLVMEYLRGETLRARMEQGNLGGVRSILQIGLQLARALECVHAQGIIHRDVKPDNVHVSAAGTVKLMDFGIAKAHDLQITQAGFILGTPHYMAPEQIRGDAITPAIDVYAFGVLLYELLAGQKPYRAESPEAFFYAILQGTPDMTPLATRQVPQEVRNLISRCMSKQAVDRPASFTDIAATLEQLVSTPPSTAPTNPTTPMAAPAATATAPAAPRRNTLWFAGAGLAVAGALFALWLVLRPGPSLPKLITTPTGDMLLVPAGEYLSGATLTPKTLAAFYIDKTEVSNRAFAAFCQATGCAPPAGNPDEPVARVTVDDARRFAQWAGKRLPNSNEWEKAARGTKGRIFPWGKSRDAALANIGGPGVQPVGAFPQGASPYGVLQLAGNVWELMDDTVSATPDDAAHFAKALVPPPTANEPWVSMRGGSFRTDFDAAVAYEFAKIPARLSGRDIGFRCVKDANR